MKGDINYVRVSVETDDGRREVVVGKKIRVFAQGRKVKGRRIEGEPYVYFDIGIDEKDLYIKKGKSLRLKEIKNND